jgi:ABC-type transport system involved in multi-copper enzyme maturation permease subunit/regulation of enolase protein 1 (concanavalin A-like superfamily)
MSVLTAYRPEVRAGFGSVLHAEWTKFRTVRGWAVGMLLATLLTAGITLLNHSECGGTVTPGGPVITGAGCPAPVVGPGGEAVTDNASFVHRPLTGDGSITARVTSFTGPRPWSKGGIMIKASTRPGSAYAAMMVTSGHGVRMQYDFTGDIAGPADARWLRLTRSGDTVTGYASADGAHWDAVGGAHLAGLPGTVQAGMFAASPSSSRSTAQSIGGGSGSGASTVAAVRFDHVSLPGAGRTAAVAGSGDIAPLVPGSAEGGGDFPMEKTLVGVFGGLIAVIVVAAMFMTAEYRRGLIRVTFTASPGRGRVLAAKAVVIGSAAFAAGLAGALVAVPLGERMLRSRGNQILPVSFLTEVRVVAGTALLLAVAAVLALAVGTIVRQGAIAVTAVIVTIVLPYFFARQLAVLPAGAADWLLRVTPAAGFAIQQSIPAYQQATADFSPVNGYYPLGPLAGFGVLCGYCLAAVALAVILLRRRDA